MLKKNNVVSQPEINAAENLDDDQEIVVTDVRTIRKGRKPAEAKPPEPEEADFIDVDEDGEPIEDDEDLFEPGSIGELLTQSRSQQLRHTQCNILVNRKADSPGEQFARPSRGGKHPAIRNVDLTQSRNDIEELVQNTYFGGHYYLQIQVGNKMHSGWDCDLADPPDVMQRIRAADPQPEPVAVNAPHVATATPADPFDSFLDSLEKQKRMRDLMFGDERERYERELAELRTMVANKAPESTEPTSEEFLLWKMATTMPDSEAKNRLLDKLVPSDEDGNKHWIGDVIKVVAENKETIFGLAGSLFGGLLGGGQASAPPSMADQMLQRPPVTLPPVPSRFGRRTPPPEPPAEMRMVEGPEMPPPVEIDVERFMSADPGFPATQFTVTDPAAVGLTPDGTITPERADELSEIADDIATDETATDADVQDAEILKETKDAKPTRRGKNAAA